MRRIFALIVAVLILALNGLPTGANTSQLKYADWEFNHDFTSVRVGEETYPSWVVIVRERDSIFIVCANA